MLGAAGPSAAGPVLLPAASESGGKLVLDFSCLTSSARGAATLKVQFSNDIGSTDSWIAYQAEVPDENGTVNGVIFNITADPDPAFINVRAEIPAQPGTRIFSRLAAEP